MTNVFLANEQDVPVDEKRLASLAQHVLRSEGIDLDKELSVLLVSRDHIKQLNSRFASENEATDVLAFPMMEDDEESELLGDVVVCPEVAQGNVASLNHSLERELQVLLAHGILHLLGYDHETPTDKAQMEQRTSTLVDSFGRAGV